MDDEEEKTLESWMSLYESTYGVPYPRGNRTWNLVLCGRIVQAYGSAMRAAAAMNVLLNHPDLAWVNNKTLDWLANPVNSSYVLPVLQRQRGSVGPEWRRERSSSPQSTIVERRK